MPQIVHEATYEGTLAGGGASFPVQIWFAGCGEVEEVCGDVEYADPVHSEFTKCAPQLVFKGYDGERDVFDENPAYRADACPPATLKLGTAGDSDPLTIDIEQYADPNAPPVLTGDFKQISDAPPGVDPAPEIPALPGLQGPVISTQLEYPTTPFSAADAFNAFFPSQGMVLRVSLTDPNAELDEMIGNGNVGTTPFDPYAVTATNDTVWAARRPVSLIEQVIDLSGSAHVARIPLGHPPYALAADGDTLWVTSLDDHLLLRVDAVSGEIVASIDMAAPTGVAVGGGYVWVVDQDGPSVKVVDAKSNKIVQTAALTDVSGDDASCGACPESIIFANGSAWIANNLGRSISRVDGKTFKVTTIPTANRVWSVAAYGGEIYGSQFEEVDGYVDRTVGGLVRIDPLDNSLTEIAAPGILGVAALGDALWLIVPSRRSQYVMSYTTS